MMIYKLGIMGLIITFVWGIKFPDFASTTIGTMLGFISLVFYGWVTLK